MFEASDEELRNHFNQTMGEDEECVESVRIVRDQYTNMGKGILGSDGG